MAESKMIQIRNVPEELHRKLKVNAAQRGLTLSDYLLSEIEEIADKPTMEAWLERVRQRPSVTTSVDIATDIRHERERM